MTTRQLSRLAAVSALTLGFLPFSSVVGAETVRTDTKLGGYSVNVEGAPFKVLLDDKKSTVPRPTGTAVVEGDPNFTLASTTTGPNSRAVGSTVWPGNLFGEGLAQVIPGVNYPLKAEARYPDAPFTQNGVDGGQLSFASAMGLDASSTASGAPKDIPGQVSLGDVTSRATTTVTDKDVAVGNVVSEVSDIDLLGGIIHIGSVKTALMVASDGMKPASSGRTTVSGLTIAGHGYTVDDTGAHAEGNSTGLPAVAGPKELAALGITISGVAQTGTKTADSANRSATGLIISVDTTVFKAATAPVTTAVRGPYSTIVSTFIPPEYQGNFYYLLNATPKVSFVLGSGSASAAAVQPLSFDFGVPPVFPPAPVGTGGQTLPITPGSPGSPGSPGTSVPPLDLGPASSALSPVVNVPPAVLQPPGVTPAASTSSGSFGGIPAGWLLLAVGASGLLGFGLVRFLALAAGLPLAIGCRLGAPTSLPSFRSVTT